MGLLEDHKIELAVAEALENSADHRAMVMLQAAADPVKTKERLEELVAATRAYDAAREAAETGVAAAEAKTAAADEATAALEKRTAEFQQWADATEARIKQNEASVRSMQENAKHREGLVQSQERALVQRVTEHQNLMARLKLHFAEVLS